MSSSWDDLYQSSASLRMQHRPHWTPARAGVQWGWCAARLTSGRCSSRATATGTYQRPGAFERMQASACT